jgi:energy-coupling factor transporter transmembrane protein EcfT
MSRHRPATIVQQSFLRRADPRTKLVLSLAASLAVMLPLGKLVVVVACYAALMVAAGLRRPVSDQLRRIRFLFCVLFALDWWCIGLGFAVLITLRLGLLVSAFTLLCATTTPEEVRAVLERCGLPRRLAFAVAMAYRSLDLIETEWHGIFEAQRARGIVGHAAVGRRSGGWRQRLGDAVALVVPAVVLVAQRAWAITEAAAARGFEAPVARPCAGRRLASLDHLLLVGTAGLFIALYAVR